MPSPEHVDNDGLVAAHDDGEPEQCSYALECSAEPPPNMHPQQRPRRKAKQFCDIKSQCQSGNTPKDMNASNACNRCKGKDVDHSGNHDLDESCATTAAS